MDYRRGRLYVNTSVKPYKNDEFCQDMVNGEIKTFVCAQTQSLIINYYYSVGFALSSIGFGLTLIVYLCFSKVIECMTCVWNWFLYFLLLAPWKYTWKDSNVLQRFLFDWIYRASGITIHLWVFDDMQGFWWVLKFMISFEKIILKFIIAYIIYFTFIIGFVWMNIMCFDIWLTIV